MSDTVKAPPRKMLMPAWKGAFEGYSRRWVHANFWRVRGYFGHDEEEAMQECALIFARCLSKYRGSPVNNHAWFMALYKTALANAWVSYARKEARMRPYSLASRLDDVPLSQLPAEEGSGRLSATLAGASAELRHVLGVIATAPREMLEMMFPERGRMNEAAHEALVERQLVGICRVKRGSPVLQELRQLLEGGE